MSILFQPPRWIKGVPSAPSAANLSTGLVSHWTLDELSGNRLDSVGSHDMILTGATPATLNNNVQNGKFGRAPNLFATDSYLEAADHANLNAGTGAFSFALWYHPDYMEQGDVTCTLLGKGSAAWGSEGQWKLDVWDEDLFFTAWTDVEPDLGSWNTGTGSNGSVKIAGGVNPDVNWYFIVGVVDFANDIIKLSVNDGDWVTNPFPVGSTTLLTRTSGLHVGVYKVTGTPLYAVNGSIDHISYWSRAITTEERSQLYNSGDGLHYPFGTNEEETDIAAAWHFNEATEAATRVDEIGNYDLTPSADVTVGTGKDGNCISIDDSAGFSTELTEDSALDFGDTDFTIMFWYKTATVASTTPQKLFNALDDGIDAEVAHGGTNLFTFILDNGSDTPVTLTMPTTGIVAGTWHLMRFDYDKVSNTMSIVRDNYAYSAYSGTHNNGVQAAAAYPDTFYVCKNSGTAFDDYEIDEMTVWNKKLSAAAHTRIYNSGAGKFYPFTS